MAKIKLNPHLGYYLNRLSERLWVKPLRSCLLSIVAIYIAAQFDRWGLPFQFPSISAEVVQALLTINTGSLMMMATFAVGSMLSAYSSASSMATPRSFPLVIADDVSQSALSAFIGAFIFSVVGLIALLSEVFGDEGRFVLFAFTVFVFSAIIVRFVRWVDSIARLGRLTTVIGKVEDRTREVLDDYCQDPLQGCLELKREPVEPGANGQGKSEDISVTANAVGYVQAVNFAKLQACCEARDVGLQVVALPGAFVIHTTALAFLDEAAEKLSEAELNELQKGITAAFVVRKNRTFDGDLRFGFIVLSEIASRALSPAVNDPGTAIDIIGRLTALFARWDECEATRQQEDRSSDESGTAEFDRISVLPLKLDDLFDDAFANIARDGAALREVQTRLVKSLLKLAELESEGMHHAACQQIENALAFAEKSFTLSSDYQALRELAEPLLNTADG